MSKIWVGIDNGVSGTIGFVGDDIAPLIVHTPVKKEQDYTKAKKVISRLDYSKFMQLFDKYNKNQRGCYQFICYRPAFAERELPNYATILNIQHVCSL